MQHNYEIYVEKVPVRWIVQRDEVKNGRHGNDRHHVDDVLINIGDRGWGEDF